MYHRTTFEITVRSHVVTVTAWGEDDSADCSVDWELERSEPELEDDDLYALLDYGHVSDDIQTAAVIAVDRTAGRR